MFKYFFITSIIFSVFVSCNVYIKSDVTHVNNNAENSIIYDSVKAKKYGADDYGMKKYVMAFLKKGPNRSLDSIEATNLQKAHLENIFKMADEGKLILAGPFLDKDSIRGIYIFDVSTIDEARQLTETDPAIRAGSLTMELREWYGSAALMEVNEIHKTMEKKSIIE
jgi:uncharacterized protein YciI